MKIFLVLITAFMIPQMGWSINLTKAQKLEDLYQLQKMIADDYGPLQVKHDKYGLNLDSLTKSYASKIAGAQSDEDFYYLLLQYVAEFKDAHFKIRLALNGEASLGFTVDLVDDKVLIDEIDRKYLPHHVFPYERGDEVISFNEAPVSQTIAQLQTYNGMGREITAKKMAVYYLSHRDAKRMPIPSGEAIVGIRGRNSQTVSDVTLPWISKPGLSLAGRRKLNFEPQRLIGQSDWCSEKSRMSPPPNSEIIQDVPFTAFIFPSTKGKIGFLRIPHYYPVDKTTGEEIAALRFSQYERVIQRFEAETVGLIIDQDYNCGGSILYVNKLLSLFIREPFTPAEFQFRASQGQIDGLTRHLMKFSPTTIGYQKLNRVIKTIESSKEVGQLMTPKIPVHGVMEVKLDLPGEEKIEPNPIGYTKPIALLINEMSGSGGDLFPAMMKDLGRAYLVGQTTMGAGGHAWNDPPLTLKHSKLSVSLTRSLFYRPNGALIENTGVEPHLNYNITVTDFLNNYQPYLRFVSENVF